MTALKEGGITMKHAKKKAARKPAAKKADAPAKKTKKATLIAMLEKGSTLASMAKATGWNPQSVRGAISTIGFVSEKAEGQDRVFRLKARRAK
jgi:hypothetical protein